MIAVPTFQIFDSRTPTGSVICASGDRPIDALNNLARLAGCVNHAHLCQENATDPNDWTNGVSAFREGGIGLLVAFEHEVLTSGTTGPTIQEAWMRELGRGKVPGECPACASEFWTAHGPRCGKVQNIIAALKEIEGAKVDSASWADVKLWMSSWSLAGWLQRTPEHQAVISAAQLAGMSIEENELVGVRFRYRKPKRARAA